MFKGCSRIKWKKEPSVKKGKEKAKKEDNDTRFTCHDHTQVWEKFNSPF